MKLNAELPRRLALILEFDDALIASRCSGCRLPERLAANGPGQAPERQRGRRLPAHKIPWRGISSITCVTTGHMGDTTNIERQEAGSTIGGPPGLRSTGPDGQNRLLRRSACLLNDDTDSFIYTKYPNTLPQCSGLMHAALARAVGEEQSAANFKALTAGTQISKLNADRPQVEGERPRGSPRPRARSFSARWSPIQSGLLLMVGLHLLGIGAAPGLDCARRWLSPVCCRFCRSLVMWLAPSLALRRFGLPLMGERLRRGSVRPQLRLRGMDQGGLAGAVRPRSGPPPPTPPPVA